MSDHDEPLLDQGNVEHEDEEQGVVQHEEEELKYNVVPPSPLHLDAQALASKRSIQAGDPKMGAPDQSAQSIGNC